MGDEEGVVGVKHLSGALKSILTLLSILALVIPPTAAFVIISLRVDNCETDIKEVNTESSKAWEKQKLADKEQDNEIEAIDDKLSVIHRLLDRQDQKNIYDLGWQERVEKRIEKSEAANEKRAADDQQFKERLIRIITAQNIVELDSNGEPIKARM